MKPLSGVTVIELTAHVAAPACPRILGDWGANIIKIEPPSGDPFRQQAPLFNMPYTDEVNPAFDMANINKKFVCLNLKTAQGKEVLYKMLETADVVVTSYRTETLKRMGLTYEELRELNPRLIFAQVLGYGEKGPEKDTAGFDATAYVARGGLLGSINEKGESPINSVNAFGDFQVSICLASGISTALYAREKTGKGDKVTVSLYHTALYMMSIAVVSSQFGNQYPKSRREVGNPFNNTYKTKDGRWMVVCIPEYDKYFNKFVTLIGREDIIGNEDFCTIGEIYRRGNASKMIDIISAGFAHKTIDEWMKILKENDFACEKGYLPTEILEDPQAWGNDCLRKLTYPTGEEYILTTTPVRMASVGDMEMKISKPLGYHTEDVIKQYGYSDEFIKRLG